MLLPGENKGAATLLAPETAAHLEAAVDLAAPAATLAPAAMALAVLDNPGSVVANVSGLSGQTEEVDTQKSKNEHERKTEAVCLTVGCQCVRSWRMKACLMMSG